MLYRSCKHGWNHILKAYSHVSWMKTWHQLQIWQNPRREKGWGWAQALVLIFAYGVCYVVISLEQKRMAGTCTRGGLHGTVACSINSWFRCLQHYLCCSPGWQQTWHHGLQRLASFICKILVLLHAMTFAYISCSPLILCIKVRRPSISNECLPLVIYQSNLSAVYILGSGIRRSHHSVLWQSQWKQAQDVAECNNRCLMLVG